MDAAYWRAVADDGFRLPHDRPLDQLTTELVQMLGSPDPQVRDGLAYPTLGTWVERGVYDDLLPGLGDGMASGLMVGIGDVASDGVFRRSFSALVLAECLQRDQTVDRLVGEQVLEWGDRLIGWLLRERDVRGYVPGKGWAHAVAHGADAIGVLAGSRHLGAPELTALLDVIADRVLLPTPPLTHGEPDRLAGAALAVLDRDLVPLDVVERWVGRVGAAADSYAGSKQDDPFSTTFNPQQLLRSLSLQLQLRSPAPPHRADLLLTVAEALRSTNAPFVS